MNNEEVSYVQEDNEEQNINTENTNEQLSSSVFSKFQSFVTSRFNRQM